MATVVERFVYALGLDVDQRSFDKGQKALSNLTNMVKQVAAVATAGAIAMIGLVKATANEADEAIKTADALGLTVEEFQRLAHAADINGLKQEKFSIILERMVRRLAEAAKGTGEAKSAIDDLGISSEKVASLNTHEQFLLMSDALAGVESHSEKVRLAYKIFGRDTGQLLLMMRGGADQIMKTGAEMDKFGLITEKDARKYEEFNDELNRGWKIIKGVGFQVSSRLLPGFLKMVTATKEWMLHNREIVRMRIDTFALMVADAFNFAWISMKSFGVALAWVVNLAGGFEKAFQLILSMGIAFFLVNAITGFVALSKAIGAATFAANLLGTAIRLTKILSIIAAIEDVITWIRGGESLLGMILGTPEDFSNRLDQMSKIFTDKIDFMANYVRESIGIKTYQLRTSSTVEALGSFSGITSDPVGAVTRGYRYFFGGPEDDKRGGGIGASGNSGGTTTNNLTVNQSITGSNAPAAAALSIDGIRTAQQELQGVVK